MEQFQQNIKAWVLETFGEEVFNDPLERAFRFFEESIELAQSCGVNKEQALDLINYTFSRPVGMKEKEVGGVMVTLAALCASSGISMKNASQQEYEKILLKQGAIRQKHLSKPKGIVSSLPGSAIINPTNKTE